MLAKFKERNSKYFTASGRIALNAPQYKKLEWFILRASIIHDWKYDYSLITKILSSEKIDIICPLHGKFSQYIGNHLAGNNCPKCSSKNTSDVVYIWKVKGQGFIKIGITTSQLGEDRINLVATKWKVQPEILAYHTCDDALKLETTLKGVLKEYNRPLVFSGDGHTEVFEYNNHVKALIEEILCIKY